MLTLGDAAAEIGAARGSEVKYMPVSVEEFARELGNSGFPAPEAAAFAGLIADVLDGRNSYLTDGVQRALGRPARDFADYARDAAATGVWNLETETV